MFEKMKQKGQILVLSALLLPFLLVIAAMAIDFGSVYIHLTQFQNAADAAALAGVSASCNGNEDEGAVLREMDKFLVINLKEYKDEERNRTFSETDLITNRAPNLSPKINIMVMKKGDDDEDIIYPEGKEAYYEASQELTVKIPSHFLKHIAKLLPPLEASDLKFQIKARAVAETGKFKKINDTWELSEDSKADEYIIKRIDSQGNGHILVNLKG